MAFRFNMQKVLDYREQMEEEAKVKLARAEQELRKGQEKLASLQNQLEDAQRRQAGKLFQPAEQWLHEQYVKGLRGDIKQADLQVRMLAQVAEEARKHLAARAIDKKMLVKLKERQKQQFNAAELKQEQYFNDEIATVRYKAPVI